jgi:hypothetical protein
MKNIFFLIFLALVALFNVGCKKPTGKVTFWAPYGVYGNKYWYYLEVKKQEGGLVFENTKITVTSTGSAPSCDSDLGFVLRDLEVGGYVYTVYYGGPDGPLGTVTGSFGVTNDGCAVRSL